MALTPRTPKMPRRSKRQSNAYKMGKLSRSTRFSIKGINKTWLIVGACVFFTFIFAVILGNILGDKAASSQNSGGGAGGISSITSPSTDKVSPRSKLHAYFADMTGADPNSSLSDQTGTARSKGNALCISLRDASGNLIYSSSTANELGYPSRSNLTLDRLNNHFDYYADYAVAYFKSDFSAGLGTDKRIEIQANELRILHEATVSAFDQIVIDFSGEINRYNVIYYQAYILELKLACPDTSVGVRLTQTFLSGSSNTGAIADLLSVADFYAIDLGSSSASEIASVLDPLTYFAERYNGVAIIAQGDEATLEERISALEKKGITSYIVK